MLFIPWARVETLVPSAIRFSRSKGLDLNGDRHIQSLFTILPRQQIRRRYPVRFERRGIYSLPSSALTLGDVTGMMQITAEKHVSARAVVFPFILPEERLPLPIVRTLGNLILSRQFSPDPFLMRGIRAYVPGDDIRSIHWPASARISELQVRLLDTTASLHLLVILNAQPSSHQWGHLMPDEVKVLEKDISLAASLCAYALSHGLKAGFGANLKTPEKESGPLFLPETGSGRLETLLTHFAWLSTDVSLQMETWLSRQKIPSGLDIILITRFRTPGMNAQIRMLEKKGCTVLVHDPGGDTL